MKVYELMDALAKLPSGAEVSCASVLTVAELKKRDVFDREDGSDLYSVVDDLKSVSLEDDRVFLGV